MEQLKRIEQREVVSAPDVIIDFIRHGKTIYGNAFKDVIRAIGQDPDTFKQMPDVSNDIIGEREQIEGMITKEGQEELRDATRKLAKMIDSQNEIVAVVTGTRTRHVQSAVVIEEELKNQGIDVVKVRDHKNLVDVKGGGWYTFIDYILKHQGKSDADLEQFWWEMYQDEETRKDMNLKGYEHLEDIATRTEKVAELLRRFVRRYKFEKTLRVICVTSDINLEQIQQKEIPMEERDQIWVKNADVVELKMWNDQEIGVLAKEEMSKPFK